MKRDHEKDLKATYRRVTGKAPRDTLADVPELRSEYHAVAKTRMLLRAAQLRAQVTKPRTKQVKLW